MSRGCFNGDCGVCKFERGRERWENKPYDGCNVQSKILTLVVLFCCFLLLYFLVWQWLALSVTRIFKAVTLREIFIFQPWIFYSFSFYWEPKIFIMCKRKILKYVHKKYILLNERRAAVVYVSDCGCKPYSVFKVVAQRMSESLISLLSNAPSILILNHFQ